MALMTNNQVFLRVFEDLFKEAKTHKPGHQAEEAIKKLIEFLKAGGDEEESEKRITGVMTFVATVGACDPGTFNKIAETANGLRGNAIRVMIPLKMEREAEERIKNLDEKLPQA